MCDASMGAELDNVGKWQDLFNFICARVRPHEDGHSSWMDTAHDTQTICDSRGSLCVHPSPTLL